MRKVTLICRICSYSEEGSAERELMNKIKMWNHVHKAHPEIEPARLHQIIGVSSPSEPTMAELIRMRA